MTNITPIWRLDNFRPFTTAFCNYRLPHKNSVLTSLVMPRAHHPAGALWGSIISTSAEGNHVLSTWRCRVSWGMSRGSLGPIGSLRDTLELARFCAHTPSVPVIAMHGTGLVASL